MKRSAPWSGSRGSVFLRRLAGFLLDRRWYVFYLALLGAVFTVLVYYPGYMSPDSVAQLQQARFGVNNNVYPPLMDYVWAVTDRIVPGPAGMLLLHTAVFWASLAVIAYVITARMAVRFTFLLVAGLWPPTFAMIGTIWKDVGMQIFLFAALACLLSAAYLRRIWPLALSAMFLFIADGYRHNAIAAVAPIAILLVMEHGRLMPERAPRLYHWISVRRLMKAYCVALAAFLVLLVGGAIDIVSSYGVTDAKLWSAALIHDLAGISVAQDRDYLPPYANTGGITVQELKRMYSPLHANSLFVPASRKFLRIANPLPDKALAYHLTDADASDLKMRWFTAVLDNPGSYLRNRLTMVSELLVLNTYHPWYPYATGIDPNPFGLAIKPSALNSFVMRWINYGAFQTPLWSAWAYYGFLGVCLVISLLWDFVYAGMVQLLVLSVFVYLASIFFFGMSGDFRYNIWALSCCYVCPFLLARGRARHERVLPEQPTAQGVQLIKCAAREEHV